MKAPIRLQIKYVFRFWLGKLKIFKEIKVICFWKDFRSLSHQCKLRPVNDRKECQNWLSCSYKTINTLE